MKITFLGAAGTVTGSKFLLNMKSKNILVDCGLYQGFKHNRDINWMPLPIEESKIDAVLLTHAHIDHSGNLPLLVKRGFKGKIYATHATYDLCKILLPDSAYLQEEDARYANEKKFSKHQPALPLYNVQDAQQALEHFEPCPFHQEIKLDDEVSFRFIPAGHILGASIIQVRSQNKSIVFSGDLGRSNDPTMRPPEYVEEADYVVVESTYGDRLHPKNVAKDDLYKAIHGTIEGEGIVLIPSFAVGRTQTILQLLYQLHTQKKLQDIPIYLDSPMAISATKLFCDYESLHKLSPQMCQEMLQNVHYIRTMEESKGLKTKPGPYILISASGMMTGGRVLHHMKNIAPHRQNLILLVGYQSPGTRGALIKDGAREIKIHGEMIPIKARMQALESMSSHADYEEILQWLGHFKRPPRRTFIVHGSEAAAENLRLLIQKQLRWQATTPNYKDSFALD